MRIDKWPLRFHITLTVGGGFTGLTIVLMMLVNNGSQMSVTQILLALAFCLMSGWAISLGLRLTEGRNPLRELKAFYLIQIPYLTAPWFSYHLGLGVMLYVGALQNGRYIQLQLGADWQTALMGGDRFYFAINIVPVAVLWMLKRSVASPALTTDPASG